MNKWDYRFMQLAKHVGEWSKDPNTRVGAVIVRPNRTVAALGFNGLPRGVSDTPERLHDRETKLDLMVHAEINALASAGERLYGCTLYVYPLPPCVRCATSIIQHGITRVVATTIQHSAWMTSTNKARDLMQEAGVTVELHTWK